MEMCKSFNIAYVEERNKIYKDFVLENDFIKIRAPFPLHLQDINFV